MHLTDREAYSYRALPQLDGLPDGVLTVMDATCGLCARGARWIARNDRRDVFRIIPLQSERGIALMDHYGLDPDDPLSWLLIENGRAYTSIDAVIRTGVLLGGKWRALTVLRVFPRAVQDCLYGLIARNRYRFMGRADLCTMPDPDVQARLIT